MKQQEKLLFKQLCNFKSHNFDESLLDYASPEVLGHLFFNRMQATAYEVLQSRGLIGKVNREFRNSLKLSYEQSVEKNESFFRCVEYLNGILSDIKGKYAMLKGAYLCRYYPKGCRTSNDIDILVLPSDVSEIGSILAREGFRQGNIRNGEFFPASRREIIESKMTRGETVPYIKEVNMPGMKFLEVDINFSLDYKNSNTDALAEILSRVTIQDIDGLSVPTLEPVDFFIHLCSHLYKEATTLPWVEMNRDMTLYKYCDIYSLLEDMTDEETETVFDRASDLGIEQVCAFAVIQTAALFDVENTLSIFISENILRGNPDFIHTVVSPKDKKILVYKNKSITERFFSNYRKNNLKEVK